MAALTAEKCNILGYYNKVFVYWRSVLFLRSCICLSKWILKKCIVETERRNVSLHYIIVAHFRWFVQEGIMKVSIYSPSKYFYGFLSDHARGFSCVSFRPHLVSVNKPKAVITNEGYHVIVVRDISVKRMLRWIEGCIAKYAGSKCIPPRWTMCIVVGEGVFSFGSLDVFLRFNS